MTKRRKVDHIYQRVAGGTWYIDLQNPAEGKRIQRSLLTNDREQAIILSLPLIAQHKATLRAARAARMQVVADWNQAYPPGLHVDLAGDRLFATAKELHYLDADGHTIRTEPNGAWVPTLAAGLPARAEFRLLDSYYAVPRTDGDDELLEAYILEAKLPDKQAREARRLFAEFRSLVGKPLKSCTREDGKRLVEILRERGLKTATIARKLVPLITMANLAIANGKLLLNPFKGVCAKHGDDSTIKLKFTDADMAAIRANLHKLSASDALLFHMLASTGMRLNEPFQIDREHMDDGVRFVVVSTRKGKAKLLRRRRIPIPEALADLSTITRKLFDGDKDDAGDRLNAFIRACGITDPAKTLHCLRHRAGARLDAAECPTKIRDALLGHGSATVGDGYGADGFRDATPLPILRKWIDRIGM